MFLPVIETPRLVMRPLVETDVDELHAVLSDERAARFLTQYCRSRTETEKWLNERLQRDSSADIATLAITAKPGVLPDDLPSQLAGYVQLTTGESPEEAIIIFSLRAESHNKHIGTEAFKMFLNNVWEHNPEVNTLTARVVEENVISAQGLISAGFSKQDSEDVTMYIPFLQRNVKADLYKLHREDFRIQIL